MPSDQVTQGDELQLEVIPETESVEDTQTTQEGEGESADTTVKLDSEIDVKVDKPLSPQEESAKRQEESWLSNVISGKKTVADAPLWLQAKLNARLEVMGSAPKIEDVVKKTLAKEREAQAFAELQKQIPPLTAQQAQELQDRFNTLKPAGAVAALQAALDAMGLSKKVKEAEARGVAKGRLSIPRSGQPAVRKSEPALVGNVPLDVIQDDKKWAKMIREGKLQQQEEGG